MLTEGPQSGTEELLKSASESEVGLIFTKGIRLEEVKSPVPFMNINKGSLYNADWSCIGIDKWEVILKRMVIDTPLVVSIAKNYLNEQHIKELNRIVSAYLDLAENRAERNILMNMDDWIKFLNNFLELSEYPILKDKGKISKLEAKIKAEKEFEKFRIIQDQTYISDFDKEVKKIKGKDK